MSLRALVAVLVTGVVAALGADLRAQSPTQPIATPIEQALIEHACSTPPSVAVDPDQHEACLHARLTALRADFGRDLGRLSGANRRAIDAACGPLRESHGREGYLNCLGSRLAVVRSRAGRTRAATVETATAAAAPAAPPVTPASPAAGLAGSPSRTPLVVGVMTVLSVAVLVRLAIRARRGRRVCRVCSTPVGQAGDLCPACRHQAAEAQRRTALERVERQHAQENESRLRRERDEEDRRRTAREAEDAQTRELEAVRREAEEAQRQEDDARRRDAEAEAPSPASGAEAGAAAFDPYALLGVTREASADAIREAYEQARSKYDVEQVADFGVEIQQHYAAKAEALARAFETITSG